VLLLIRRYRQVDVMQGGLTTTVERVPQGEPLSPLLSNIMLDDLDKELERRRICRAIPIIAGRCRYDRDIHKSSEHYRLQPAQTTVRVTVWLYGDRFVKITDRVIHYFFSNDA
jgi:retron-type reverse transcriptase